VNLLSATHRGRVMQAGNSIGGAISADGTLVAAQNYTPGGVKVFDAARWNWWPTFLPAEFEPGKLSRVVGLVDLPGRRFAYSLFDADAIWIADLSDPARPVTTKLPNIGRQPYDALVTPNGRHYIAGLFGEDGLAMVDLWETKPQVRRILAATAGPGAAAGLQDAAPARLGRGRAPRLPARDRPPRGAGGRHRHLAGGGPHPGRRPARVRDGPPDGRQVWVNFSVPDYHRVQVIDTTTQRSCARWSPARPCCTWNSRRAANRCGSARATTTASA
jgi:protein NirF